MFERLSDRISHTLRNLRGIGKIRESNIAEALSEVKASLLEADVQYKVVQSFVDSVRQKALGQEVLGSVEPGQQFVKILYDELLRILGGKSVEIPKVSGKPLKILLMGLQGSGKTTTAAKLAKFLRDDRRERPFLIPTDTVRPAAREQLEQLGAENSLPVFLSRDTDPVSICEAAIKAVECREVAANCLIFDTQGRLAVDKSLIGELKALREAVQPDLVFYVLDSMTGQDAVRSAEVFTQKIGFDGMIVTKLDGDARGGAALSVCVTTGKPIYFVGIGEKLEALERLHPDRLASRILGMGDIVTLVERAEKVVDLKAARELSKKIQKNQFTIEDFAEQIQAVKKMGSFEDLIGFLPGGQQMKKDLQGGIPENELKKTDAIIKSMTQQERRNFQIIDGNRRKRIANGSGTTVTDVNRFLKQFVQARSMLSRLGKVGVKGLRRGGGF